MELGCFLAGVMISGQGPAISEQIEHTVQPVKDFLGCIFFCSIGKQDDGPDIREGPLICALFKIRTMFGFNPTHPPSNLNNSH